MQARIVSEVEKNCVTFPSHLFPPGTTEDDSTICVRAYILLRAAYELFTADLDRGLHQKRQLFRSP